MKPSKGKNSYCLSFMNPLWEFKVLKKEMKPCMIEKSKEYQIDLDVSHKNPWLIRSTLNYVLYLKI